MLSIPNVDESSGVENENIAIVHLLPRDLLELPDDWLPLALDDVEVRRHVLDNMVEPAGHTTLKEPITPQGREIKRQKIELRLQP